jgi:hypothetical protein
MAELVGGFATLHAYTFVSPERWAERRQLSVANYRRLHGVEPPDPPERTRETLTDNLQRYHSIAEGHAHVRARLRALRPDVVVLIGDDQDENYTPANLPQFSIFTGDTFTIRDGVGAKACRSDAALATALLGALIERDFDPASSVEFAAGTLLSHAHVEPIIHLLGDFDTAIVPIFVNAIHVPAPTPARCLAFGRALREAIAAIGGSRRVALLASGGLSHFSAGYPYRHYKGPFGFGAISIDFDRQIVDWMQRGNIERLAELTNAELLANGEIELRQWIVLLGALGKIKPEKLVYEPFFAGIMGMSVGAWAPVR